MPIKVKPRHRSESAGGLRWLLTYSDMITLLLALFIVLYALEALQNQQFQADVLALSKRFGAASPIGQAPGSSIIPGNAGTQVLNAVGVPLSQSLVQLAHRLQQAVNAAHLQNQVHIELSSAGVRVSLEADLLFPSGLATLSPQAVALLQELGTILNTVPNPVEVIGDTDSVPIRTAQYPSNWQLGAARSANVTYWLASRMKDPARLIQVSFSKYAPIASNATPAGRQANRRVDILVLSQALGQVLRDTATIGETAVP